MATTAGLRLPPLVAPQQVVIVPIYRETEQAEVIQAAAALRDELQAAGVRVRLDDRSEYRPGFKFNEWELKGVPVRIEVGGRDLAAGAVTVARRDTGEKQQIPLGRVAGEIRELLGAIQSVALPCRARRPGTADTRQSRRLPGDDRVPARCARVRLRIVVRQRGMRGARQGRELRDDPVPAARTGAAVERVHLLWPERRARGGLGTGLLSRRNRAEAGRPLGPDPDRGRL